VRAGPLGLLPPASRRAVAARILTLPAVTVAAVLTTRLVVQAHGAQGFGVYAIAVGLAALLPFADLGVGAALTDVTARRAETGAAAVARVYRTSLRTLVATAALLVSAGSLLGIMGWWPLLLGAAADNTSLNNAVTAALITFGLALPGTAVWRIMVGADRNAESIALQALAWPFTLLGTWLGVIFEAPLWILAAIPASTICWVAILGAWRLDKQGLPIRLAMRGMLRSGASGERIRHLAGPMAVINITIPLTYQSDRIILNWVTDLGEVAQYSLAQPLYQVLMALVGAAAMSLWPAFARRRRSDRVTASELRALAVLFLAIGCLLGSALVVLGPTITAFMGAGSVTSSHMLLLSFATLLAIQCLWYPYAMFLMDREGLRAQAVMCTLMAGINLPASLFLAAQYGAAGPALGSAVAMSIAVVAPGIILAHQRVKAHRGP
jgi:O-antigen/teichoic acid export membrane protein